MMKHGALDWVALVLVVVGGINWGLVGAVNYDLVGTLLGVWAKYVYDLVGLAALYMIYMAFAK